MKVDETSSVVFRNKVTDTAKLSISKSLAADSDELVGKSFPISVKIQGEVYTGSYSVNGIRYTTNDGIIAVKGGEVAQITGLPYGTSFEVEERLDDLIFLHIVFQEKHMIKSYQSMIKMEYY